MGRRPPPSTCGAIARGAGKAGLAAEPGVRHPQSSKWRAQMVRDHLQFPYGDTAFNEFLTEFQGETDRAAAVLAAAFADELLKALLSASFVDNSRMVQGLLGRDGAAATFSARVALAYAIGLISHDEADDLDRLRRIRNDFAHQLHGLSFGTQRIKDLANAFRCVARTFREHPAMQTAYPSEARKLFDPAVAVLCHELNKRVRTVSRFVFRPIESEFQGADD
jgi:DNA-binding MltR family transcriptional regulator